MSRKTLNPDSMYPAVPFGFSHATISEGGRTIHCAGQVAWDAQGNVVGAGDLAAQIAQSFQNLKDVLAAAGATPDDVVRIRTYVVNHSPDKLAVIGAGIGAFFGGTTPPANTLIGVQCLALPDFLIEIEATAVVSN
ncbi:RidA family protein [Govanella unica]|uniref:RidA family protein n=1 Tax=Govanella unica TaxID=2975056 RepID=A0A9X3TZA2_9PROT|nr:RidA family protein [Govania unica]MDA5194214.1 RidA family protein [Govania unica]